MPRWPASRRPGRRAALYFYREPGREAERGGIAIEIKLANLVRQRVRAWRESGYAGLTRTTLELLQWWRREGREPGPNMPIGIPNRIFAAAFVAWTVGVALAAWQVVA